MKISAIKQRLNLAHSWTISRNSSTFKENVFVKIDHEGQSGIGEAAPNIRYKETADLTISAINNMVDYLDKTNPHNYQDVRIQLKKMIRDQNCARAAVEMALLDWVGKTENMPLYASFGLDPDNISLTSYSIGIDTISDMQKKVEEFAHMPIYKIKLGTDRDRQIITAIREVTNKPIRVDINEAWKDKTAALHEIEWLAKHEVEFVEQPLPANMNKEMIWLKERSPLPLIADESVMDKKNIPGLKEAFDGINIKLMKAGGILEALDMIKIARSLNMKIMLGCMIESSVAISAAAHIAPLVDYIDLDGSLLLADDPYTGVKIVNGKVIFNDLPGLGVSKKK